MRLAYLVSIHILSFFHKLRYDLARELVVGLCSLVLMALFYYVFNDFLNVEVQKISPLMRDRFAEFFAWFLLVIGAFASGRLMRQFFSAKQTLYQSLGFLGEDPKYRTTLAIFHCLGILSLVFTPILAINHFKLIQWTSYQYVKSSAIVGLILASTSLLAKTPNSKSKDWLPRSTLAPLAVLVLWRLRQILLHNRLTQFCLSIALPFLGLLGAVAYFKLPFVGAFALSYWIGFLSSCALSFQYAEDLEASWIEKNLGVSHKLYLDNLFAVASAVGVLSASCVALVWILGASLQNSFSVIVYTEALKLFFISFACPFLVPAVLFQIDARRSAISILASFLMGLFLATAVYASWLGLALFPLVFHYAYSSQEGRFYRA